MATVEPRFTTNQIKLAGLILEDLSELLFDQTTEYNDQSSMVNDVNKLLDEHAHKLTRS